ncbi:MAG: glutaredoxin family protein [Burkholderiales bacterium]|jgi:glutaredoxin|nr:glutaredoxin family protein [Burkholderiales bacterium]
MTQGPSARRALTSGLAAAIATFVAAGALAQGSGNQVYRYQDSQGRIVYSDKPPPAEARNAESKRVGANFIETDQAPLEARMAVERYPVTLFTFDCGEVCQKAEALLNRRGVPFATVNVQDPANAARLEALTGEMTAPVLQVGDKLVAKGFNEARWTAMLDEAGYPKAPAPRRTAPGPRAPEAPPSAVTQTAPPPPAKGSGYPSQ